MNNLIDKIISSKPGTIWKSDQGYFIRSQDYPNRHIEGDVFNMFTGDLIHASTLTGDIKSVYLTEVMV